MKSMKIMKFRRLLIFKLFVLVALASGAQVIVEMNLDRTQILIGEQVQLRLKCSVDSAQVVSFPTFHRAQELIPGVEVLSNGSVDTLRVNSGRRWELTREYTLTSFDSALYTIPPFEVLVDGEAHTAAAGLGLKVETVPVDTVHVDQFCGPGGVVTTPFEWTWKHTLLVLAAWLSAIVAFLCFVRLTDPKALTRRVVIHPPTPPHVEALSEIEHIKQMISPSSKTYYTALTEVLRSYIEKRFGFNALEMTTSQIVELLMRSGDTATLSELKEVLATADLVKFAKHAPTLSDRDRSLVQALDFVQTTKLEPLVVPKARVEYVTIDDKHQHRLRLLLALIACPAALIAFVLTVYVVCDLYLCFG